MPRGSRLGVTIACLASLVAFAASPAVALAHWTDVPFPEEAYSGWVRDGDSYDIQRGVSHFTQDANGNIWAVTWDYETDTDAVYLLRAGASAWERADQGIPMDKESVKAYWDIFALGDRVFVNCTAGVFRRTASDSAWRRTKGDDENGDNQFLAFDGTVWTIGTGDIMRYDIASDTWVKVTAGIPKLADGTEWGNFDAAANSRYLYLGLYGGPDRVPEYGAFSVYRLARGSRTWKDTGLRLKRPGVWDEAKKENDSGGVSGVASIDGYAFALARDGDATRDFVYDEATGKWSPMPVAPDTYGTASIPGLDDRTAHLQDLGSGRLRIASNWDSAAGTVEILTFEPATGMWTRSDEKAYPWQALWAHDVDRIGRDYIISPPEPGQQPVDFVSSVPLPTEVSRDPKVIGTNAVLALFFAAAFGFTSAMFNNTLKDNYAALKRMTEPIARVASRARTAIAAKTAPLTSRIPSRDSAKGRWRRFVEPITIVAGTALIYCFLDPGFGLSASGLGLFVSMGVAVSAVTLSYEGLQSRIATRRYEAPAALKIHAAALGVAIACVLISRTMSFHPGYVYGMVGGLAFVGAVEPESDRMGRLVLISSLVLLAVSVVAWLLMIPVAGLGDGFLPELARGSLAGVFVMGLEGLLFGLMPMRFMDGEKVWEWNRWAWLGLFALVAFSFWHVLLNRDSRYLESLSNKNVQLMLGLLLLYSAMTFATWGWFRSRVRAAERPAAAPAAVPVAPPPPSPAAAPVAPPPPPPSPAAAPVAPPPPLPPASEEPVADAAEAFFASEGPVPVVGAPPAPAPANAPPPPPPAPPWSTMPPPDPTTRVGASSTQPAPKLAPPPASRPAAGPPPAVTVPVTAESKSCPMCAEDIKPAAKVCRYCGAAFDVVRRGYCRACGDVKGADEADLCRACGSALVDPHIVTSVRLPDA